MSKQEGQNFALSKGALFKEVSAKRNEGVQEVFEKLVDEASQNKPVPMHPRLEVFPSRTADIETDMALLQIVARPELWNKSHQSHNSSVPGGFPNNTVTLENQSSSWSSCSC